MGNLERSKVEHNFVSDIKRDIPRFQIVLQFTQTGAASDKTTKQNSSRHKRIELWAKIIGANTRNGARLPSPFPIMAPGSTPCLYLFPEPRQLTRVTSDWKQVSLVQIFQTTSLKTNFELKVTENARARQGT